MINQHTSTEDKGPLWGELVIQKYALSKQGKGTIYAALFDVTFGFDANSQAALEGPPVLSIYIRQSAITSKSNSVATNGDWFILALYQGRLNPSTTLISIATGESCLACTYFKHN